MALTAEATVQVRATPRSVLEFVMDLDRYREVDPKIVRVGPIDGPDGEQTRVSHRYEFRFRGPFRIVERPLTSWLQHQTEDEVRQLADRVDT